MDRTTDWRADPGTVAPTVLLLGGFLTSPPIYRLFAQRMLARGAADVVIAGAWTPDSILAGLRGFGAIVTRAGRALREAGAASANSPASRAAPVLVVGHSAGGLVARLLTVRDPFEGRRFDAAGRIGAIVTLGTPHAVGADAGPRDSVGVRTPRFANEHVPGAAFAPWTGYLSVTSRAVAARPEGSLRERLAATAYPRVLGPARSAAEQEILGDGLIPAASAVLAGAPSIVLDRVLHGPLSGGCWFGSADVIDAWWPAAVEAWRGALAARLAKGAPGDGR